jgi:hypothetical protein
MVHMHIVYVAIEIVMALLGISQAVVGVRVGGNFPRGRIDQATAIHGDVNSITYTLYPIPCTLYPI